VTERSASVGAVTGESPLFVLSDTSTVWVQLHVFPADVARVQPGLPVTLLAPDGQARVEVPLGDYLPTETGPGQTRLIRFALPNPDGHWTPGLRVHAVVHLTPHAAKLAVATGALQSFRDFTVVFAQVEDTYEVRMLELGRRDDAFVEVLGGLRAGERYVTHNSYLVKADALKAGASHDH
jgi:cobalt-zinc-cadmium efflux system membrane fusion protein